jgi:tRNA (cmo5U34)-methyltransferase
MSPNRFDQEATAWDQKQRRVDLANAIAAGIGFLPLHAGMAAMEYGCGTGLVGLAIAPRVGSLLAVDTSTGMLEVLTEKAKDAGITNVTPLLQDLTAGDIPQRFDLIFSAMTLHHIEETGLILEKFYRHLNVGGIVAIADLDREDGSFHSPGAGEKHHGFNRRELTLMAMALGFSDLRFSTVHTIRKTAQDGSKRDYPVFLLVAKKEHVRERRNE